MTKIIYISIVLLFSLCLLSALANKNANGYVCALDERLSIADKILIRNKYYAYLHDASYIEWAILKGNRWAKGVSTNRILVLRDGQVPPDATWQGLENWKTNLSKPNYFRAAPYTNGQWWVPLIDGGLTNIPYTGSAQ